MLPESISYHNQIVRSVVVSERFSDHKVMVDGEPQRPFIAASIAKPYLAAAMVQMHNEGSFNLDESVHISLGDFKEGGYGTGRLRRSHLPIALLSRLRGLPDDAPVTMRPISRRKLLELMVGKSDNIATLILMNNAGRAGVQQVLDHWGMKDTKVYNPEINASNETTASDAHLFLHKLHEGELIAPRLADELKSWMPRSSVQNSEQARVTIHARDGRASEGVRSVYHKIGYMEGSLGEHCFVILTEGTTTGSKGQIPYSQELRVQALIRDVAGFVA